MRKKLVSLVLVLVLLFSCSAAFAEYSIQDPIVTPVGDLPVVSEPTTVHVGVSVSPMVNTYEYGENYLVTLVTDVTGVDLKFDLFSSEDGNSKLRLMVSGGETLPDLLMGFDLNKDAVRESYGQAEAIIPLNPYIGTLDFYHSQRVHKVEESLGIDNLWSYGRSLDGNYYGWLAYASDLPTCYAARAWYNKDFAEALGMEDPGDLPTQEWLLRYLRGVRDNDVNGNGDPTDEIPMTGGTGWNQNLILWCLKMYTYMDYSNNWFQIENGTLSYAYTKDEFREGLKFVRQLYDEQLFPDFSLTQDNSTYNALVSAETPIVGVGVSGSCSGFKANMPHMAPLPVVAGPDGFASATYFENLPEFSTCISANCEHPEVVIRMLDAMSSEDWYCLVPRQGELGVDWDFAKPEDKSLYEQLGMSAYYTELQSAWGVPQSSHINIPNAFGIVDSDCYRIRGSWNGNATNNEYYNALAVTKQSAYAPDEYIGKIIYTVDEQEEWADVRTAINTYVSQKIAEFATGVQDINDDAVWTAFQNDLVSLNYEGLLAMDQAAYNRTMGK